MIDLRRVAAVASKEWREILRDRLFLGLAVVVPSLLMVLLGYGLSLDVEHLPFAALDHDRSRTSRDYLSRFVESPYFDFRGYAAAERDLDRLLTDGAVRVAIVIPEGFEADLEAGRPARVQTLVDGTFPSRALTTKGYVIAINGAASADLLAGWLARTRGVTLDQARRLLEPVRLEVRYLYNQRARSVWSIAPGLMMVVLLMSPPFLTALGIVREKESGAIYNIYASPVSRAEFLAGKLAPYAAISVANAGALFLLATGLFGAPFKGDGIFFAGATVLYVTCATAIGLVVSALVRTQAAAMAVTSILTMIPAVLYSGFLVPVSSLAPDAQVQARLLPAMYYTNIVMGSFLRGVGVRALWQSALVLAGYAAVLFAVGYLAFSKRPRA